MISLVFLIAGFEFMELLAVRAGEQAAITALRRAQELLPASVRAPVRHVPLANLHQLFVVVRLIATSD